MEDRSSKIKIDMPDDVRFILDTIRRAGYEAYIVGGCVRDSLLGRVPEDWDITTSALPGQVKELFRATVDTGIRHGTVMIIRSGQGYEVTTYRIDGNYSDGRHPESVTFTPNLEEDLKRRDFTINAFAYDPEQGIVDLFGGLDDLEDGMIRAVGDPRRRFDEDALRIMRAVRFSAQLSFDIEKETEKAISEFAEKLALVSAERIRVEFEKTLYSANPSFVNEFARLNLARHIVPDHWGKCFSPENARIMEHIPDGNSLQGRILRLAAFFKNLTPQECSKAMRAMTFDNRSRELVCGILKIWEEIPLDASRQKIKQMLNKNGEELFELAAEFAGACGKDADAAKQCYGAIIRSREAYKISMLDVNGADLIGAGVPEGAKIGETLNMLLDRVMEDPQLNKKDLLLNFIRSNE